MVLSVAVGVSRAERCTLMLITCATTAKTMSVVQGQNCAITQDSFTAVGLGENRIMSGTLSHDFLVFEG